MNTLDDARSNRVTLQRNMMKLHKVFANIGGVRKPDTTIAMGTDTWAFPGIGAHLELEHAGRAAVAPTQAPRCAANQTGKFLTGSNGVIGRIETGATPGSVRMSDNARRQADLLILDANTPDDLHNTRSVRTIIRHGQVCDHQQLIEEPKQVK